MKLNILKGAVIAIIVLAVSFVVAYLGAPTFATTVDDVVTGFNFGWSLHEEASSTALYYLDGSTTVALTLSETRIRNWDWIDIMYETASDVWTKQTADITLKDSDSDGYVDWLGFTATGGATAGGEVRIRAVAVEGGLPVI